VNAESALYISAKLRGNKHKKVDLEYLKRPQTFKSGKDKKKKGEDNAGNVVRDF